MRCITITKRKTKAIWPQKQARASLTTLTHGAHCGTSTGGMAGSPGSLKFSAPSGLAGRLLQASRTGAPTSEPPETSGASLTAAASSCPGAHPHAARPCGHTGGVAAAPGLSHPLIAGPAQPEPFEARIALRDAQANVDSKLAGGRSSELSRTADCAAPPWQSATVMPATARVSAREIVGRGRSLRRCGRLRLGRRCGSGGGTGRGGCGT